MFKLYTTPLSANGRKVQAACHQLGLHPEIHPVNVYRGEGQTPAFLAVNPAGRIPVLVDERCTLTESNAILQYVSEAYGEFELSSKDAAERAAISSWLFWESAHWQPAITLVLAPLVGNRLLPEAVPAPERPPDWANTQLRPLLEHLDKHVGSRRYLTGSTLSIADFSVAGMTTYFHVAGFPFADFPHLEEWHARVNGLAAWKATETALWSGVENSDTESRLRQ